MGERGATRVINVHRDVLALINAQARDAAGGALRRWRSAPWQHAWCSIRSCLAKPGASCAPGSSMSPLERPALDLPNCRSASHGHVEMEVA
jgi:hypothetical protein